MDTIELDNLDQPEGAKGGDEGAIAETPLDYDDFEGRLTDSDKLDDARTSSFRNENKDDTFRKRKRETYRLSTIGKFDELKAEYVKMLFEKRYRLNKSDGQISKEFFSRLDIDKHQLTFDGTMVVYIGVDGIYRLSYGQNHIKDISNFLEFFDKAEKEHKAKAISTVEEETGGETSRANTEDIYEDAREEIRQEAVTAGDNLVERAKSMERRGKLNTQETREIVEQPFLRDLPKFGLKP